MPCNIKLTIYNSLVRSNVEYWGRKALKKITIPKKHAVRLIDNSKTMTHVDQIFPKYHILKIIDFV